MRSYVPPASAPPAGAGAVAFEKVAATHGPVAANTLQVVPELCPPPESPQDGAPPAPAVPPPAVPAEPAAPVAPPAPPDPPAGRELPQATREVARKTTTPSEDRPTLSLLTAIIVRRSAAWGPVPAGRSGRSHRRRGPLAIEPV